MAAIVRERSGFLQHLPSLLSLADRGFVVVEGSLRASMDFTYLMSLKRPQPEMPLSGDVLQAMVSLIALEARFAGTSNVQMSGAALATVMPEAAAAADASAASADGNVTADSSMPTDSYSLTLMGISKYAISCLTNASSSARDAEHLIEKCGPALMAPEVLRRIVCRPECSASSTRRVHLQFLQILAEFRGAPGIASPPMVVLRRNAGNEALDFILAGIREKLLAPAASAAGVGASAEFSRDGCRHRSRHWQAGRP